MSDKSLFVGKIDWNLIVLFHCVKLTQKSRQTRFFHNINQDFKNAVGRHRVKVPRRLVRRRMRTGKIGKKPNLCFYKTKPKRRKHNLLSAGADHVYPIIIVYKPVVWLFSCDLRDISIRYLPAAHPIKRWISFHNHVTYTHSSGIKRRIYGKSALSIPYFIAKSLPVCFLCSAYLLKLKKLKRTTLFFKRWVLLLIRKR